MNKKRRKLLLDLKIVAAHLRLRLSSFAVLTQAAIALDRGKKRLVVMNESDHPYFKTIDLDNVEDCAVKVEYRSINAGDLQDKNIDDFIESVQLHIAHSDPAKSVKVAFYNARLNTIQELKDLAEKAKAWRDKLCEMVPRSINSSLEFKPVYHEQ